ncbi:hypothetical protein [Streptomyces sp. NPDC001970]
MRVCVLTVRAPPAPLESHSVLAFAVRRPKLGQGVDIRHRLKVLDVVAVEAGGGVCPVVVVGAGVSE